MIRYKDLTVDNAFDFCALLETVGIGQITATFDKGELARLMRADKNIRSIGVTIVMKIVNVLIRNLPIAREAIYDFLAGCTEIYDPDTNMVTEVTAGVLRTMKIGEFVRLLKDFAKHKDLTDFFKEVSVFVDMGQDDSKTSSISVTETPANT